MALSIPWPPFTRNHGGLGLGLAIARHLVEMHGVTIAAFSGGHGKRGMTPHPSAARAVPAESAMIGS